MAKIELDYVGFNYRPRYTHYPSGDTCLRQPFMNNDQWEEKKREFFAKYPNVELVDENNQPIDKASVLG